MKLAQFRSAALTLALTGICAASIDIASAQVADPTRSRGLNTSSLRPPRAQDRPATTTPAASSASGPVTPINPPTETQKSLEGIAAIVNGDVITRLELRDRVDVATKIMQRQNVPMPSASVVERQVLERMIVEKAQIQVAVEDGVRIDDQQLDRAMIRVAEQNGMTLQQFRDRLEKEGQSFAGFRDDLRTQILIERARSREVDDKIQVGEGEVDAFIAAQNGGSSDAQPEIDIAQVLVRVPENAPADQVEKLRAKAEDVFRQAKGGADFGKLAVTYSDAPEALQGGDLGFRSQDRLPTLFTEAIGALSNGDVAAPVRSPNGFHVLKVIARRVPGGRPTGPTAAAQAPVEQTHARHILIKVNEVVTAEQAKAKLEDIRARIVGKTATFEDMARAYSNDTSASRGGDLGTLYAGDTVPEFERAMNALKPGEVSQPVQTPFGYHLIEVVERKKQDVAQDRQRLLARQAIRERKVDEAAENWARETRDRAYVEMRIDDRQ